MDEGEPLFDPGVIEESSTKIQSAEQKSMSWDIGDDAPLFPPAPESNNAWNPEFAIRWKYSEDAAVQHTVDRVRLRNSEDLQHNFDRAMTALQETYIREKQAEKRPLLRFIQPDILTRRKSIAELDRKAGQFADYFEAPVFGNVLHAAEAELSDEVELKSPNMLAIEAGKSVQDTSKSSGERDRIIGNTDYVFANSVELPSRSFFFNNTYRIASEDGYVVPVDIADFKLTAEQFLPGSEGKYIDAQIGLYADNIYKIPDFKKFFATYNAAFFDSPQDALDFYKAYGRNVIMADFWEHPTVGGRAKFPEEHDQTIFERMRELYNKHHVYPPIMPEFQFRHSVPAKRVLDEEVLAKAPGYR